MTNKKKPSKGLQDSIDTMSDRIKEVRKVKMIKSIVKESKKTSNQIYALERKTADPKISTIHETFENLGMNVKLSIDIIKE